LQAAKAWDLRSVLLQAAKEIQGFAARRYRQVPVYQQVCLHQGHWAPPYRALPVPRCRAVL
jgi:hypothetical protein